LGGNDVVTVRTLESLLYNITVAQEKQLSVQELARAVVRNAKLLHATRQDTTKESRSLLALQQQSQKLTETQLREAQTVLTDIRLLSLGSLMEKPLECEAEPVVQRFVEQEHLLAIIIRTLYVDKESKFDDLQPVVERLIEKIQELQRKLIDEEETLERVI
jgi:hypothetical protein